MTDTIDNIMLPANTWVDLYAASGIAVGTHISIENLTHIPIKTHTSLLEPSATADDDSQDGSFSRLLAYQRTVNNAGDSGAWAFCHKDGLVNVNLAASSAIGNGASDLEYGLNIQRGLVPGIGVVHTFGRVPNIDVTDNFVAVTDNGGLYTGFDAVTDEAVSIVSDNANDTVAGTGGRVLLLSGLGAGFVEQSEIINMNGLTPVISTLTYIRLNPVLVIQAGSENANLGKIIINQSTTTSVVFSEIEIGNNRTLNSGYTVPAGKEGYIRSGFATTGKKQSSVSEVRAMARQPGSTFQIAEWFSLHSQGTGYVQRPFVIPLIGVPAGTDILIQANTDTNGVDVSAGLEIMLVDV